MDGYTTDPIDDDITVQPTDLTLEVEPTPTLPTILPAPFLTPAELKTHMYTGVVNAITDGDNTLLPQAIAAATQEAMGYMSRFDFITILSETGNARDPILLQYLKDMATWHFIVIANPNIDYEVRLDRYKYAIKWFEKIQGGRYVPAGWPIAIPANLSSLWHIKSRKKRGNNY